MLRFNLGISFIILSVLPIISLAFRLNVPKVLLPFKLVVPTNYTLEVTEGGCYRWTSSRPDVATVELVSEVPGKGCSSKALVSVTSHNPSRMSAMIIAEDEAAGITLKCDVIVDAIHSIEIVTTTQELFLDDAPEAFEVRAKNDQGDTFSSLGGIPFEWSLISEETKGVPREKQNVLRHLKFSDSLYKRPESVDFWEKQDLHGSYILVEGINSGSAKVGVRINHPFYKDIKEQEVNLVVVANLVLNPAHDVFLVPGSVIQYRVEIFKQQRAFDIPMPSEQYFLEMVDPEIAVLDVETSTVTALKEGHTSIELKDRNMKTHDGIRKPSANIYVVEPSYLIFHVKPGDNFALQEYTTYMITISLYDVRHHRIYPSDNLRIRASFPSHYFHVNFSSPNGTYHVVRTLNPGPCKLRAELLGVALPDGTRAKTQPSIEGFQDVIIYQSVKILPSFVLLPWDPVSKPMYTVPMKASGGTTFYRWHSSDSSVASVSFKAATSETATVTVLGPGDISITVADIHNSFFAETAQLSVQPIADIDILPTVLEAELNSAVILPVALYGYEDIVKTKRKVFDDCSKIPLSVEVVDKNRFTYDDDAKIPPMGKGCQSLQFSCRSVGYSRIYVKYQSQDILLNTTTVIACHKPLKTVFPARAAVLAIGTTAEVAFEGGPRPWPLHESGHFAKLSTDNKNLLGTTILLDPYRYNRDLHVYRILCKDFGETELTLHVGNEPSPTNKNPAANQASVKIFCGHPYSVHMKPKLKDPKKTKAPCPVTGEAPIIPVHNNHDLEVEVWVKDKMGRKFANITSFDLLWEVSDNMLAKLKNFRDSFEEVNGANGYRKVTRNYQIVQPLGKEGHVTVSCRIKGYRKDVLTKEGSVALNVKVDPVISRSLKLELVSDAEVKPEKVSVFNHPSNKITLNITKGSGYFFVESSVKNKAEVLYNENIKQIEVKPLQDGLTDIMVHDLCLDDAEPAITQVQISGVSKIDVKMVDKVQIGKSITAVVEILNSESERLPASVFKLMNLRPVPAADTIGIKLLSTDEYRATYAVKGVALGHTHLRFVTGPPEEEKKTETDHKNYISSRPVPIQVFDSLHVHPKNITLIVGAAFQVTCTGGPQPYSELEYNVQDTTIATVFGAGIISASKLGRTVLTVRAVGTDKDGGLVVYSQAQVNVFVVPLHGIRIHAPLTRMQAGTEMPVYAVGLNEHEIPFAFGSASPQLIFHWIRDNPEVATLETEYKKGGVQQTPANNFYCRVVALQPGLVRVKVEVEVQKAATDEGHVQLYKNLIFKTEVKIQVFGALRFVEPEIQNDPLLISPDTHVTLKTSRDGLAHISYAILPAVPNQEMQTTVTAQGHLKTGTQIEDINLVVTSKEEFDVQQQQTLLVKVNPVSYIMTTADTVIRTDGTSLSIIPLGTTMLFSVSFHDSVARKFHATKSQLKFRPSRFDLLQLSHGAENGTIVARALLPGETVVKIWDSLNPLLTDFINIVVGPAVEPADAFVNVGDVLCFSSPLISKEGHPGVWHVEGKAIEIDHLTGVAVATDTGTVSVFYNVSDTHSSTQVHVSPMGSLAISASHLQHITNVPQDKPLQLIIYIGEEARNRKGNRIGKHCNAKNISTLFLDPPFTCSILFTKQMAEFSPSEIFTTEVGFDIIAGHYYCRLYPVDKVPPYQISKFESSITVTVEKKPFMFKQPSIGRFPVADFQSVHLPFLPSFYVHVTEVTLNHIQNMAVIPVSGIPAVLKHVKLIVDTGVLEVLPPKSDPKQPNTMLFPISLQRMTNFVKLAAPVSVTVECDIIRQQVKVVVVLPKDEDACYIYRSSEGLSSINLWDSKLLFTILTAIVATIFLFFGYMAIFGRRYQAASPQTGYFLNSSGIMRGTPPLSPALPYSPMPSVSTSSRVDSAMPQTHLWSTDCLYRTPTSAQRRSQMINDIQ